MRIKEPILFFHFLFTLHVGYFQKLHKFHVLHTNRHGLSDNYINFNASMKNVFLWIKSRKNIRNVDLLLMCQPYRRRYIVKYGWKIQVFVLNTAPPRLLYAQWQYWVFFSIFNLKMFKTLSMGHFSIITICPWHQCTVSTSPWQIIFICSFSFQKLNQLYVLYMDHG